MLEFHVGYGSIFGQRRGGLVGITLPYFKDALMGFRLPCRILVEA